jgi:hypothetical protein
MRTPAYITGPIPTAEEIAKELGMSEARTKWLFRLADEAYAREMRRSMKASKQKRGPKTTRLKAK